MSRGELFWDHLGEISDMEDELRPGQSVVEISGCRRVLIEHHCGVKAYNRDKITVKMKYGFLHICGSCLELGRMSREQLVIRGTIDGVSIQRR